MSQPETTEAFPTLSGQQYMNLITFRKSGEAVKTPVWFAQRGDKLYVTTGKNAGKVKRIRNNERVQVGPSDRGGKPLGPTIDAKARILPPEEHAEAKEALNRKYGLIKTAFDFFTSLAGTKSDYLEIRP
jgi:hypothetical protein